MSVSLSGCDLEFDSHCREKVVSLRQEIYVHAMKLLCQAGNGVTVLVTGNTSETRALYNYYTQLNSTCHTGG